MYLFSYYTVLNSIIYTLQVYCIFKTSLYSRRIKTSYFTFTEGLDNWYFDFMLSNLCVSGHRNKTHIFFLSILSTRYAAFRAEYWSNNIMIISIAHNLTKALDDE